MTLSPANSSSPRRDWTYDSAGRLISTAETSSTGVVSTLTDAYNGDGELAYEAAAGNTTSAYYLIRSSVLGGEVVTRVNSTGSKVYTYVPVEGLLSARQAKSSGGQEAVEWTHTDPVGLTEKGGGSDGAYDALGNYAMRAAAPPQGQLPPQTSGSYYGPIYGGAGSSFTNAVNYSTGCKLDGAAADCNSVMSAANAGMARVRTISSPGLVDLPGLGFVPAARTGDEDVGRDVSTLRFLGHANPQNTTPPPDTCEQKLASIFGGRDAIMRTRYDYQGNYRGRDQELAERVRKNTSQMGTPYFDAEHLYNFPHLSGNLVGTSNTGIYVPEGFDPKSVTGPTKGDAVVTLYYPNWDFTLAIFHVKDFGIRRDDRNAAGSIRIGTTGGPGGDSSDRDPNRPNLHSHFELWSGRTGYLPPSDNPNTGRNAVRIPFVFAYCPPSP